MTTLYRCCACKAEYPGTYPDGSVYFHACAAIPNPKADPTAADFDPREPAYILRDGHRDENLVEGLHVLDGKHVHLVRDKNDAAVVNVVHVDSICKAEGKGRTLLE